MTQKSDILFLMSISSLFSSLSPETVNKIQSESSSNLYKNYQNIEEIQKQQKLILYYDSEIPQLEKRFNDLISQNEESHNILNEKTILHQWYSDFSQILQDLTEMIERKNSEKAAKNSKMRVLSTSEEEKVKEKVNEIFDLSSNETDPRQFEQLEREYEYLQELNKKVEEEISILKSVQGKWNPIDDVLHSSIDSFCDHYNIEEDSHVSLDNLSILTPFGDIAINEDKKETPEYEKIDKQLLEDRITSLTEHDKTATTKLEDVYSQQIESMKKMINKIQRYNLSDDDITRYEETFMKRIRSMGHLSEISPINIPSETDLSLQSDEFINKVIDEFKQFLHDNNANSEDLPIDQNQKEIASAQQVLDNMTFENQNARPHTLKQPFVDKNLTKLTLKVQKLDENIRSNIPTQEFEDITNLYKDLSSNPFITSFDSENSSRSESRPEATHEDFDFETEEIEESIKSLSEEISQTASEKLPESLHSFFHHQNYNPKEIQYLNDISNEKEKFKLQYQKHFDEIPTDGNNEPNEVFTEDPNIDLNVQMNALLKQMEDFSIPPVPTLDTSSLDMNIGQLPFEDNSDEITNALTQLIDPKRYQALMAQELRNLYQNRINQIEPHDEDDNEDNSESQLEALQKEYNELTEAVQKTENDYNEYFAQIKEMSHQISSSKDEVQKYTQECTELQSQAQEIASLQEELDKEKADFESEKMEQKMRKQMFEIKLKNKLKQSQVKNE